MRLTPLDSAVPDWVDEVKGLPDPCFEESFLLAGAGVRGGGGGMAAGFPVSIDDRTESRN